MSAFELHPRLAGDTLSLGDWPLCRLLLMNESRYPWFILVPRRAGLRELCQLDEADTQALMGESRRLSGFLLEQLGAHKLNVAALGNVVPQLHVHHIARYTSDAAWPAPVWGRFSPEPYLDEARERLRRQVAAHLPDLQSSDAT